MNQPRVEPRRCNPNTVTLVAPAAAIWPNSPSRCSTESVRCGSTGATITWQDFDDVGLHHHLVVEVGAGVEVQIFVSGAGETVAAAMRATAVPVDRVPER